MNLALKYGMAFAFREDTVYDGLTLFDRVMCCGVVFNPNLWPLCLCSCILLCARQVCAQFKVKGCKAASGARMCSHCVRGALERACSGWPCALCIKCASKHTAAWAMEWTRPALHAAMHARWAGGRLFIEAFS